MRNRVTITIKDDLLEQVDRLVDGLTIRSRSQAIEYLLSKFLSDFKLKNALVLAGGKDTRMLPLTKNKPKFILKIKEKALLEHVMDYINGFNVSNFFVYVDYFKEKIKEELNGIKEYDVNFIESDKSKGTIEPLMRGKSFFKDTFLVVNGDTISSVNLNEMLLFHKKNKSLATIALTTVSNPKDYGVAMLQGDRVNEFKEKPKKEAGSYLVSAGYYIFEPEIFKYISREMKSMEKELFPRLAEKGLLYGYPFQGMYINVNTAEDFEKAKRIL